MSHDYIYGGCLAMRRAQRAIAEALERGGQTHLLLIIGSLVRALVRTKLFSVHGVELRD